MARDDDGVLVIAEAGVDTELFFKLATRCAVVAGSADICIGGRATAGLAFFGSVEDSVLPLFLPINTDILLSLRSFRSCFAFAFSPSFVF